MTTGTPSSDEPSPFDPIAAVAQSTFVRIERTTLCREAIAQMITSGPTAGDVAVVTDEAGHLSGLATLHECLKAEPTTAVGAIMRSRGPSATPDWTAEEAAHAVVDDDLDALAVLDGQDKVIALVTPLAAHRYLLDKVEDDANDFVGIVGEYEDDYMDLTVLADFRRRIPWVLGLAVAGLAAGYVVHIYEDALDALVILALYMPMVADTGGNVGTQSASLVTRAISFGDVRVRDAAAILWRETRVALLLAAVLFLFVYLKVLFISNSSDVPDGLTLNGIGLAIAVALSVQVVSATVIGAVLPIAAVALRQDPAVVSGPALTTIVDFTGLVIYFAHARLPRHQVKAQQLRGDRKV
ncbi:MAG: magnesium transporter, partial [Pseudomonadota bacterium]